MSQQRPWVDPAVTSVPPGCRCLVRAWPARLTRVPPGLMRTVVIAMLGGLTAACGGPALDDPEPWRGTPVRDEAYEEVLRPDVPVESDGLFRGRDGRISYAARLASTPWPGYLLRYEKLLRSRGFLMIPYNTNVHVPLFRRLGTDFLFMSKVRPAPYTLAVRSFRDTDARWTRDEVLTNYPAPVALRGRVLSVRLGEDALTPWQETVLVPDRDVLQLRELPFPRFPGAVLSGTLVPRLDPPEADRALRTVLRTYIVRGASMDAITRHYVDVTARFGSPVTRDVNPDEWTWYDKTGIRGVQAIAILRGTPSDVGDTPFQDLRRIAPEFIGDFPADARFFSVRVMFTDLATVRQYWHPDWVARHDAALAKGRAK